MEKACSIMWLVVGVIVAWPFGAGFSHITRIRSPSRSNLDSWVIGSGVHEAWLGLSRVTATFMWGVSGPRGALFRAHEAQYEDLSTA
jgi:hypothetical protein